MFSGDGSAKMLRVTGTYVVDLCSAYFCVGGPSGGYGIKKSGCPYGHPD